MADYTIWGLEHSYFTVKVMGLMDLKHIPYDFRRKTIHVKDRIEKAAGTRLMPVVETGTGEMLWDSTPLAFEMDRRHPTRPVIPGNPMVRLLARVLEDYLDEWFPRFAVHFRWQHEADRAHAADQLVREFMDVPYDKDMNEKEKTIYDNVMQFLAAWALPLTEDIGVGADRKIQTLEEFQDIAAVLDARLADSRFLLGGRPTLPDLSLYGAMKAHCMDDPTPAALIRENYPILTEFVSRFEDAAGEGLADWPDADSLATEEGFIALLRETGKHFHPFLAANRKALADGAKEMTVDLGWGEQRLKTRRYTEKCRQDIAQELAGLSKADRDKALAVLQAAGLAETYCL